MKKLTYLLLILLLAGCAEKDLLCDPITESPSTQECPFSKLEIIEDGYLITRSDESFVVKVPPIEIVSGYENQILNDTANVSSLDLSFSGVVPSTKIVSSYPVEVCDAYIIRRTIFKVIIENRGICIPIEFIKDVVSIPKKADGSGIDWEQEIPHKFSFNITNECIDPSSKDEEENKFVRTTHKLQVKMQCKGVYVGTINTVMSFYAPQIPITFGASVKDEDDITVEF